MRRLACVSKRMSTLQSASPNVCTNFIAPVRCVVNSLLYSVCCFVYQNNKAKRDLSSALHQTDAPQASTSRTGSNSKRARGSDFRNESKDIVVGQTHSVGLLASSEQALPLRRAPPGSSAATPTGTGSSARPRRRSPLPTGVSLRPR
jgi:hypothetical protein